MIPLTHQGWLTDAEFISQCTPVTLVETALIARLEARIDFEDENETRVYERDKEISSLRYQLAELEKELEGVANENE